MSVWTQAYRGFSQSNTRKTESKEHKCDTDKGFTGPFLPLSYSEVIRICEQRIINGEPGMIPDLTQLRETDPFG